MYIGVKLCSNGLLHVVNNDMEKQLFKDIDVAQNLGLNSELHYDSM